MRRARLLAIFVVGFACQAEPVPSTEPTTLERRLVILNQMDAFSVRLPDKVRGDVIGAAYDKLFAPAGKAQPPAINTHDLDTLYQAARIATFYTLGEQHLRDMVRLLGALEARGAATQTHYRRMYEAFVHLRMLTEARHLAQRHPDPELEMLPEVIEAADLTTGRPTELVVDETRPVLAHRTADLSQAAHVIVVSHPLCHFSQAAAAAIEADPEGRAIFEAHARWLAPQDDRIPLNVFQRWLREHRRQKASLAYRRDEWPMIDVWTTPTFYFFKSGVLVTKVDGWPKGGHMTEVRAALRQIGLL